MVGFMSMVPKESIVDVEGVVVEPEIVPENCSIKLEL